MQCGTKTTPILLPADGEASWLLLPSCYFNQPNRKRWATRRVDIVKHLPHKGIFIATRSLGGWPTKAKYAHHKEPISDVAMVHHKGSIDKKVLSRQQILAVKGVGGLNETVKKGKLVTEIFFQIMLNEVLTICEK